jgi:CheY-like chemotaxis protein
MLTPKPGRPRSARRHILLIEDNPDGRESLRMLLSMMGHQVDVAEDGVEGLRKALELHPEVAIVDIGLPRMDGFQVARRIRAGLGRSIILLACTAYDRASIGEEVAAAGFDAHLVKPMELRELTPWLECAAAESLVSC